MVLREVKPTLEKCIEELIGDIEDDDDLHLPNPSCIKVADLGCSSGPNTFLTLQQIVESIDKACSKIKNQEPLRNIQYFLNDLVSNDFNLVFKGLPQLLERMEKENNGRSYGSCLVASMPGTFYGKLFPDRSMHFFHSSYSLHWLSQVPSGLVTESGIPRNKGSIYFSNNTSHDPHIHRAYLDQFTQDFTLFLRMRSQEIVQHGRLLLTFVGEDSEQDEGSHYLFLMGMALTDMVVEGHVEKEKLDSFNVPFYTPSVHETKEIIENEGSFKILRFQTFKTCLDASFESRADVVDDPMARATYVATYHRAAFGTVLVNHFGEAIMDSLFRRFADKLVKTVEMKQGSHNNLVISLCKH